MRTLLVVVAAACLLPWVGLAAPGDDPASPDKDLKAELREIEVQNKRLSLQSRVDEINFDRQMRELDLEKRRIELEKERVGLQQRQRGGGCHKDAMVPFALLCLVIHILLAVWVFQDIRKRNAGSGLWIVVTLLTGLLGAVLYALVRIGDKPA